MINEDLKGYDGFINQDGNFYKVKKISYNNGVGHYEWADKYIRNYILIETNPKKLLKLKDYLKKDPVELLINQFGFVYYSHDNEFNQPIVKGPNSRFGGFKPSDKQLNTLMNIMILNGEDPFKHSIMFDERDTLFIERTIGGSYEKNICKGFK